MLTAAGDINYIYPKLFLVLTLYERIKMSIYPLYKEVFPPTVVDNVVCAAFTSPNDVNLIVARTSILQIYRFVEEFSPARLCRCTREASQSLNCNFHREVAKRAKIFCFGCGATSVVAPAPTKKKLRALRGFAVEVAVENSPRA